MKVITVTPLSWLRFLLVSCSLLKILMQVQTVILNISIARRLRGIIGKEDSVRSTLSLSQPIIMVR